MLDAYVATGPNALKLFLFLEEVPLEHRCIWLDLSIGDHRTPEYLKISPSAKVPAIVDHAPADGGSALSLFESGAILMYLAEKTGQLLPHDARGRAAVAKWLFWQVAALGPMSGQARHFQAYAPKGNDYARIRYEGEVQRLYQVLEKQLADHEYVAGAYSIADLACLPWIHAHKFVGIDLTAFPNLQRWLALLTARPAVLEAIRRIEREAPRRVGTLGQYRKNLFHNHCAEDVQVPR